jgi:hypothetical protein
MPLEINYRPVILPPGAVPAPRATLACAGPAEERPRDFAARIRKRDVVSVRQTLLRPTGWRAKAGGIAALGALGLVLGSIGWGSPGGIDAAVAQDRIAGLQPFEQAGESFPGSAFYYVSPDDTGLLTPHAAQAAWDAQARAAEPDGDIGPTPLIGPSARPLMARGSSEDRWRALQCLTAAIYYEAASEPDGGQRAVAQVVLNRVAHPAYPKTVCGVVYQGSERPSCQFSFACDGSMARVPMRVFWDRARRVAADALAGYVYAPVGLATHYHTTAIHPYWADSLSFIGTIGAHRFYRWGGAAGQARAFNAVYVGGEPVAAPHPRTWTPTPADVADPVTLEKAFEAGRLTALQAPAHAAPAASVSFGQAPLPHATTPAFSSDVEERGGDAVYRARTLPGGTVANPAFENAGKWIAQPAG